MGQKIRVAGLFRFIPVYAEQRSNTLYLLNVINLCTVRLRHLNLTDSTNWPRDTYSCEKIWRNEQD